MTLIVYLILWLWLEQERLAAEAAAAEAVRLEEERLAAEAAEAERLAVEAAEEERLAVEAAQASVPRQASKNSLTKSRQGSLASLITSPDAIIAVATPGSIANQRLDLSSTIGSTTGAPGVYSSRNWASPRLLAQRVTGGMQRLVYRRDPVEYGKGPTHYVPTKPSQPVYGHRTYRTTKSDRGPNTSPPKDRLPSMPLDRLAAVVMAGSPTMFTGKAADPPWLGGRGVTPAAPPHTSKNLVRV